ncbi:MAG: AMP-binding protein [Phycisphaeraceae bacterium]|nr:AMP-binding protein [Phycisphaeraceae bacterium]
MIPSVQRNLAHRLHERAEEHPERAAIIKGVGSRRRTVTYRELDQQAQRISGMLVQRGLQPGDRMMPLVPMSTTLYALLLGAWRAAITVVIPGPEINLATIRAALRRTTPGMIIAPTRLLLLAPLFRELRRVGLRMTTGMPLPWAGNWQAAMNQAPTPSLPHAVNSDHPALITFTSGGTGEPKAIVRTHGFLSTQHRVLERDLKLEAGQIDLTTMPIFLLANLASGLTSVLPEGLRFDVAALNAAALAQQIQAENIIRTVASPTVLERLADHCIGQGIHLSGVRRIDTGGAPVFPRVMRKLERIAPEAELWVVYGSTEAEPIAHVAWKQITPDTHQAVAEGHGLIAGCPVEGINVRILTRPPPAAAPDDGHERDIPTLESLEDMCAQPGLPGAIPGAGEIIVTGDHVVRGYLDGRGDAQSKIMAGHRIWHRTGDGGYIDARSRLWLLGRWQARLTTDQGTLFPLAVECAASEVPGVVRSALVNFRGEPTLVVESDPAISRQDIASDLEGMLKRFGNIRLLPVRSIPVDARHRAKIDYPALERMLSRRPAQA